MFSCPTNVDELRVSNNNTEGIEITGEEKKLCRTGVIGSDVPWLECPACNALTWVITVTE